MDELLNDPVLVARAAANMLKRTRVLRSIARRDSCWIFSGSTDRYGEGRVRIGKTHILVGRLMWRMVHGAVPPGAQVAHTCTNKSRCVHPGHLKLRGT